MSRKSKLVLEAVRGFRSADPDDLETVNEFKIAKTVNTLEYGEPGNKLSRADVDKILKDNDNQIRRGNLTVEIINGGN